MKLAGAVLLVLAASGPLAGERATKPRVTWGDWVGTYDARLTWHQCSAPGAKTAKLAIDAVDGVMSIELAPASPGLRAMSLVADASPGSAGVRSTPGGSAESIDDSKLSAQQGDVVVQLRHTGGRVELAIALESGCVAKGTLTRVSNGSAQCTRLVAWARVEAKCTKLTAAPLEDLAALAKRTPDAASCATRAERLERALVDVGCAPHPDPLIGVRARDCLELVQASAKLERCGRVPPPLASRLVREAKGLASAAQSAERATLPYVEQQCRDVRTEVAAVATQFGCP